MSATLSESSGALLTYSLQSLPNPLIAGESGTVYLLVSNTGNQAVNLSGLAVSMLQDDPPNYDSLDLLASPAPSNAASMTSTDGTQWLPAAQGNNTFLFTPQGATQVTITTQGLEITLSGLPISTIIGTAQLTVKEWATVSPVQPPNPLSDPPSAFVTVNVPKFSSSFSLGAFTATPPNVTPGASTILAWSGTDAIFQIAYGSTVIPGPTDPPLPESGSQTITDLLQTTVFTLSATEGTGGPSVQSQLTVTVELPAPTIESFTGILQSGPNGGVELALSWTTGNSFQCAITGQSGWYQASAGTTLYPPFEPQCAYTLTAYNTADIAVSQPLSLTWAPVLTLSIGPGSKPQGVTSFEDGQNTLLYVTDGANNNVVALNITNFSTVPNSPASASGNNPCGIALSIDGSLIFVINYHDASISTLDRASLQSVSTFNPMGIGSAYVSAFPIAVSSSGEDAYVLGRGYEYFSWQGQQPWFTLTLLSVANGTNVLPASQIVASTTSLFYAAGTPGSTGSLSILNIDTQTPTGHLPIPDGDWMASLAISRDGSRLYVGGVNGGLSVVDTTTFAVVAGPVATGLKITNIALLADQSRVVVLTTSNTLIAFNALTLTQIGNPIPVGSTALQVAPALSGPQVYVTNSGDGTVSIVTLPASP